MVIIATGCNRVFNWVLPGQLGRRVSRITPDFFFPCFFFNTAWFQSWIGRVSGRPAGPGQVLKLYMLQDSLFWIQLLWFIKVLKFILYHVYNYHVINLYQYYYPFFNLFFKNKEWFELLCLNLYFFIIELDHLNYARSKCFNPY
jgi:hypothetical protein